MTKTLTASVHIDASPDQVWAVLSDFDRYPDWNPFIVSATGTLLPGARLALRMQPVGAPATTVRPRLVEGDGGPASAVARSARPARARLTPSTISPCSPRAPERCWCSGKCSAASSFPVLPDAQPNDSARIRRHERGTQVEGRGTSCFPCLRIEALDIKRSSRPLESCWNAVEPTR